MFVNTWVWYWVMTVLLSNPVMVIFSDTCCRNIYCIFGREFQKHFKTIGAVYHADLRKKQYICIIYGFNSAMYSYIDVLTYLVRTAQMVFFIVIYIPRLHIMDHSKTTKLVLRWRLLWYSFSNCLLSYKKILNSEWFPVTKGLIGRIAAIKCLIRRFT